MMSFFFNQPLEQFQVHVSGFFFTNFSSVTILLIFFFIFFILLYSYFSKFVLQGVFLLLNYLVQIVRLIFIQQLTNVHILIYFPLILSISFLILFSNLYGLLPYGFTITSHIWLTAILSVSVFFGITIIGFINGGLNFLRFFVPSGVNNIILLYFLIFIEIISYLIRPLSLSIRLFANMLAGHTLLYILVGSALSVHFYKIYFFVILPLLVIFAIIFLEIGIAFIQAYVFTVLVILYFIDVYSIGH